MYSDDLNIGDDVKSDIVPKPVGYKLLLVLPSVETKTKGGIILPDKLKEAEETASIVGYVMEMGDLAYKDENKFPDGPWCKVGDWVLFRSYSGTRFKVADKEFRLINDDTVEAVVLDPREVKRA